MKHWKLAEIAALYAMLVMSRGGSLKDAWGGGVSDYVELATILFCVLLGIANGIAWWDGRVSDRRGGEAGSSERSEENDTHEERGPVGETPKTH